MSKIDDRNLLDKHVEPAAVIICRNCGEDWIATPANHVYCPHCHKNYFWQGPESEKFSGPEFRK